MAECDTRLPGAACASLKENGAQEICDCIEKHLGALPEPEADEGEEPNGAAEEQMETVDAAQATPVGEEMDTDAGGA
eukprot:scaffold3970_cov257-Pinguiococcus_pyrenoidosus.AAC.2